MRRTFEANLEFGTIGRDYVVDVMTNADYELLLLDELPCRDGHGPRTVCRDGKEITPPDIQAMKLGRIDGVEVKTKEDYTLGRISGLPEHGIDQAHYDHYLKCDRRLMPTYLVFVEVGEWPHVRRDVYAQRISNLSPRGSAIRGKPVVDFIRDEMRRDWLQLMEEDRVTTWSMRSVVEIQKQAFDDMHTAWNMHDYELAAQCAAIVTACSTLRLAGQPARSPAHYGSVDRGAAYYEDTNDVGAYQSEAEYMRDETPTTGGRYDVGILIVTDTPNADDHDHHGRERCIICGIPNPAHIDGSGAWP